MWRLINLFAVSVLAAVCLADVKSVPRLDGAQLAQNPVIDGVLNEGEWAQASTSRGFINPYTGAPPSEDTEVWIGYTQEAIFVAFKAHESDTSKIVAYNIQPGTVQGPRAGGMGGGSISEDVLEFSIDPFNSRQGSMSEFRVNALGTTSENIAGGRSSKREFRGEWGAKAMVGKGYWTAEMRIPWNVLNLPSGNGLDMDINFARGHARTQITSYWADLTLRRLPERLGVWQAITPPKSKARDKMDVLAYVAPEYDEDADSEYSVRAGGDVRYAFNSQLSGLMSVNPDFKNIEQQVTSISFTRSTRFESDNRPFFSEGSGFFGRGGGGMSDQLFYSRAISDFDEGAKFYGMLDKNTSVGALTTYEDGDRTDAVMNVSRTLGARSSVSMFASRSTATGLNNSVYAMNGRWGSGNYRLSGEYNVAEDAGNPETAGMFNLNYSVPKFTIGLTHQWVEPNYRPELGFVQFQDLRGYSLFAFHNAQYQTGPVRSLNAFAWGDNFETFDDHNHIRGGGTSVGWTTRQDVRYELGARHERYLDEEESTVDIGLTLNASNRNRGAGFNYTYGSRDRILSEYFTAFWKHRLENGLDLGLSHSFLNYDGRTEQTVFTAAWELDKKQSIAARAVRRDDDYNYYFSYSSSGFTGMDWYLIVGDPNASSWRNRASLKFVWAF